MITKLAMSRETREPVLSPVDVTISSIYETQDYGHAVQWPSEELSIHHPPYSKVPYDAAFGSLAGCKFGPPYRTHIV